VTAQPTARTQAQDTARATALELFKQGATAYKAGDYDAALTFFRKAQAIYSHEPLIILALAKTFDRAKESQKARSYYQLFLKEAPADDKDRSKAEQRIAEITRYLRALPGKLALKNLPSQATVEINGVQRSTDDQGAIGLAAGKYDVSVTLANHVPFERRGIALEAGETREIAIVLLKPVDPSTLPRDHTWTWVSAGATGIALLAASGFAMKAFFAHDEYASLFDLETGNAKRGTREKFGCDPNASADSCPDAIAEGERLAEETKSSQRWSLIMGGASLGLGIATAAAYFAAPIRPDLHGSTRTTWSTRPWMSTSGAMGASVSLRF
jgi:tetratricopeptide (TPR) repeat protein